jgi:hypothetical protein
LCYAATRKRFKVVEVVGAYDLRRHYGGNAHKRVCDAIRRLVRRGLLRKVGRGYYELDPNIIPNLGSKEKHAYSRKAQVVDSTDYSVRWLGDREVEMLAHLSAFERFSPRDLVPYFCSNRKVAYNYVQRLVRKGLAERVARGVYRLRREVVEELLRKTSIRRISGGRKPRKLGVRLLDDSRAAVPTSFLNGGGLSYYGLFLDNVRWYDPDGQYHQLPRSKLLRVSDPEPGSRLVYSEITHVVGGETLGGVVVVYTNPEDFGRFGVSTVRVEWRPPSGYVARNGLASAILMSKEELVKAFKALATVLGEVLDGARLRRLYGWLGRAWRMWR